VHLGHAAATIPPPTVVTPVLASSPGYNSVPIATQVQLANPQDTLRKAQEEAKVRLQFYCSFFRIVN
jgi:hypothetical protein